MSHPVRAALYRCAGRPTLRRALFTMSIVTAMFAIHGFAPTQAIVAATENDDLQYASQFRSLYGLDADRLTVTSAMARFATSEFGLPLSPSELTDIRHRVSAENAVQELRVRLEDDLHSFGGVYIDQAAGGIVDIAVLPGKEAWAAGEERAQPVGIPVRIRVVPNSMAALRAAEAKLAQSFDALRDDGVSIVAYGLDIPSNRLTVRVQDLAPSDSVAIAALVGPGLVAVTPGEPATPAACTRTSCPMPMKGGLKITSSAGGPCTSGFLMSNGFGGNTFVVTAGHCASGTGSYWKHSTTSIGQMTKNRYISGSYADVGAIDIPNSYESNKIFIDGGVITSITSQQGLDADNPGDTVCHSGVVNGTRCGPLEAVESTFVGSVKILAMRRAQIPFTYGDSGSPVYKAYTSTTAVGIGSAFDASGNFWYSHIYFVGRELGLVTCLNSTCT